MFFFPNVYIYIYKWNLLKREDYFMQKDEIAKRNMYKQEEK